MKILMIGNSHKVKGGITSVIQQIECHKWSAQNIEMKFIATYNEGNNLYKTVFFIYSYIKIFIKFILWKPDVIYMHMSHHGSCLRKYLIYKMAKRMNIKTVIHLHGSEFNDWYKKINLKKQKQIKELLRNCNAFIVLGTKWKSIIKHIEPKTNVYILNNCVEIPKEICTRNNTINALFLGVLIKRKGVSDLIEAIKILKNKDILNKFNFYIAGEGEEKEFLIKKCIEYEICDKVKFTGWINNSEKMKLMQNCNLMILPSYNEGLPICLLEGMSYGMPLISTDVGDISVAVQDNVNGFLFKPGDVKSLAVYLEKMIDKDLFIKFSKNSRSLAEKNFSDKLYFNKLETIFRT